MSNDNNDLDKIKEELSKYADGDAVASFDEVITECNAIVTRTILGAFGLSAFADQAGGAVTTINNFTKGITATTDDFKKFEQWQKPYSVKEDRPDYDKVQVQERRKRIKSEEPLISGYTGKELPRDGRAQLEHIVSVGEIEGLEMPKNFLFMDKADRVKLAYNEKNLTMIEASANQSKGDKKLNDWLETVNKKETQINAERFGVDVDMAKAADEQARETIKKAQNVAAFKKQGNELLFTGIKSGTLLGAREVIAAILIEFNDEAIVCVKKIMVKHKERKMTIEELLDEIKEGLINVKDRVMNKFKDLAEMFFTGFGSGFCTNLLTFLINNFITTAKNVVVIIRESVYALVRAGRILVDPSIDNHDEKIKKATDIIVSAVGICLTVLLGEVLHQYMRGIPFSDEISQAISGIIIGVGSIMIIYYFEVMQAEVLAATAATAKAELSLAETSEKMAMLQKKSNMRRNDLKNGNDKINKLKF